MTLEQIKSHAEGVLKQMTEWNDWTGAANKRISELEKYLKEPGSEVRMIFRQNPIIIHVYYCAQCNEIQVGGFKRCFHADYVAEEIGEL